MDRRVHDLRDMQLTPQTAPVIHRIFDGSDAEDLEPMDDDDPYAPPTARLVELHAALAWLAALDASQPDDDDDARDRA